MLPGKQFIDEYSEFPADQAGLRLGQPMRPAISRHHAVDRLHVPRRFRKAAVQSANRNFVPGPAGSGTDISPFIATALVAQIVRNCNRHPLTAFDPREDSPWQFSVESPALLADGPISRPG
ncbi:MAG: hypothetical protein J0H42_10310 [Rhizobiales bacterium]|nr:hypothetical protein [Hyphomicrobiales bacterium]